MLFVDAPDPDAPPLVDLTPVANAGPDQEAYTGEIVVLNGESSFDPLFGL